jgi:acyl-CoA thioesterase-1
MRILVFGDSITQGLFDEESGGWCNRLTNVVIQREKASNYEYDKSVVNLGVSGDTTEDLLRRIQSESEARLLKYPTEDYDVVILAIGVNDTQFEMVTGLPKIDLATSQRNLEKLKEIMAPLFAKVVIVGLAPVLDERIQPMPWKTTHGYSNERISEFNRMLASFAQENGYIFVSLDAVYKGEETACLPDGIHPTAQGHQYIYERVYDALETNNIL